MSMLAFVATITFDTLKFTRRLRFQNSKLRLLQMLSETLKVRPDLATRQDIEIAIRTLEANLVRWIIGAGFLQTTLIAALFLKFSK
jgi:hypothetical protein